MSESDFVIKKKLERAFLKVNNKKKSINFIPFLFLLFIVLFVFSSFSYSAQCFQQRGTYFHETYQANLTYYTDDAGSLSGCNETVVMSGIEYAVLEEQAKVNDQNHFDEELYDMAIEAILRFHVAGFGIGAILAMLFKLRR